MIPAVQETEMELSKVSPILRSKVVNLSSDENVQVIVKIRNSGRTNENQAELMAKWQKETEAHSQEIKNILAKHHGQMVSEKLAPVGMLVVDAGWSAIKEIAGRPWVTAIIENQSLKHVAL